MAFKNPAPTDKGLCRRTPPAIFPTVLGLLGLGLAWRLGAAALGLPNGLAEIILGAVSLLFAFSLLAYGAKLVRRPGAIIDDLRVLPGRAGLAALVLCPYLMVMVVQPYGGDLTGWLYAALIAHGLLVVLLVGVFVTGPPEQRRVTPVWHLSFVGFIIGALAAARLGLGPLSLLLFALTLVLAAAIWAVSVERLIAERTPAPLRPLLAIHLSPAALFGLVAAAQDLGTVANGFALLSAVILLALLMRGRWVAEAGFSPLWGALTFPLAATASLWLTLGGVWRMPGIAVLMVASLVIPWIAWRVLKLWASGRLSLVTNAAIA